MADLYTKNGNPLTLRGDDVYDRSGRHVGRRSGNKIYTPSGRYAATIVGNRAIYRSVDGGTIGPSFAPHVSTAGSAEAGTVGTADWGEEPTWR